MLDTAKQFIQSANNIVIIQAENPDGDSLGSSLALEEVLSDLGKTVTLYCPVDIPKYLHYIRGWDRVQNDFPFQADAAIIVDTSADVLLSKVLETPGARHFLERTRLWLSIITQPNRHLALIILCYQKPSWRPGNCYINCSSILTGR